MHSSRNDLAGLSLERSIQSYNVPVLRKYLIL